MRNPAGEECPHYYQDFHRGRAVRECRQVAANDASLAWQPSDCALCSVPAILRANADAALELRVTIEKRRWFLGRRVTVSARCRNHERAIADPYVGCVECLAEKPGLEIFRAALSDEGGEDEEGDDR